MTWKLLVISHSTVVREYQGGVAELGNYEDLSVTLVSPAVYLEGGRLVKGSKLPGKFKYISLKTVWGKSGRQHIHFYPALGVVLKRELPDLIFLDEEPRSFISMYTIFLNKFLNINAKVIFSTSANLLIDYKKYSKINIRRYLFPYVEKYCLNNSDGAITANRDAKNILYIKGFRKPVSVIPVHGIDPKFFRKSLHREKKESLCGKDFCIGFIGRVQYQKGIDILIKAASKLKFSYKLVLIGRGAYENELRNLSSQLGIEKRIQWIGWVNRKEIPLYLNCFDVLVVPSRTLSDIKEQFGRVLIEAMACEIPVIGSTSGEIPNVIGDAGLIFEEENVGDLVSKLNFLYSSTEKVRTILGQKARERVIENYTYENFARIFYKFCKDILIENRPH